MLENIVNKIIKKASDVKFDTNKISDGYHTFGELYEHRIRLFIALVAQVGGWYSRKHSDGTSWDGWFIMGINARKGKQITYHLPMRFYDEISEYPRIGELEVAPKWDGHTSEDVLKRLKDL